MSNNVSIVIVSHSRDVAKGAADMARQMVGDDVKILPCGGDADGGLGTNVAEIYATIEAAYSDAGVLVLVDLGGAETNSEMAIEMFDEDRQANIALADAAIVEGAVMAATEASSGAPLAQVKATAEE